MASERMSESRPAVLASYLVAAPSSHRDDWEQWLTTLQLVANGTHIYSLFVPPTNTPPSAARHVQLHGDGLTPSSRRENNSRWLIQGSTKAHKLAPWRPELGNKPLHLLVTDVVCKDFLCDCSWTGGFPQCKTLAKAAEAAEALATGVSQLHVI